MIEDVAAKIQQALEAGDFEAALPLIETYGQAVKDAMQTASARQRKTIAGASSAFLSDRLHLARVMRAQLATQWSNLSRAASYSASAHEENSWHMEG